jgi:hypothetical protein
MTKTKGMTAACALLAAAVCGAAETRCVETPERTVPVPVQAADLVGFVFDDGASRLCVVTDLGQATPLVGAKLARCHAAIVESNHDSDMLMQSGRPWALVGAACLAERPPHGAERQGGLVALLAQVRQQERVHLLRDGNRHQLGRVVVGEMAAAPGNARFERVEVLSQTQISARYTV